jgi:hypothetical protein
VKLTELKLVHGTFPSVKEVGNLHYWSELDENAGCQKQKNAGRHAICCFVLRALRGLDFGLHDYTSAVRLRATAAIDVQIRPYEFQTESASLS